MANSNTQNTFGSVDFSADFDETMERNAILAEMYAAEDAKIAEINAQEDKRESYKAALSASDLCACSQVAIFGASSCVDCEAEYYYNRGMFTPEDMLSFTKPVIETPQVWTEARTGRQVEAW